MPHQKIHRGKSKLYAHFINVFGKLSYRLFSSGGDFIKIILSMVDFKDKKYIVDIGCGSGNLLLGINNKLNKESYKATVIGIDFSTEMIRITLPKVKNYQFNKLILCDATNLPFKDNTIDLFFNVLLLHHLPLPLKIKVLQEISRALSSRGTCLLMDIDKPSNIFGFLIILPRLHIATIRESSAYGLEYCYSHAGLVSLKHLKKLGLFSYHMLKKS